MRMDEGCDTGPVFERRETPIGPRETSGELFERLSTMAGEHLEDFLGRFPEVPAPRPQPQDGATHAAKLEKSEGIVDWTRPAAAVLDHVRGMDPWPGAVTHREDQPLKLFGAGASTRGVSTPGTVVGVDEDGLHISCGDGCVWVAEVQPAGKRRMDARAYAAGRAFAAGERLGVYGNT